LHGIDEKKRLAVYRAPPSRCRDCRSKEICTPQEDSRRISRPLTSWAETDVGSFHRRLSLLLFGAGIALSAAELVRSAGQAGAGFLLGALVACLGSLARSWNRESLVAWPADTDARHPGRLPVR
jgi:hypothetical protein